MFNTLARRQDRLEERNVTIEEKAKRLEEEIQAVSSNLSKISEDFAAEKSLHVETAKVLEKAFADLKEAKAAIAEAQERQRIAEEQSSKLAQEVNNNELPKKNTSIWWLQCNLRKSRIKLFRKKCLKLPQGWTR